MALAIVLALFLSLTLGLTFNPSLGSAQADNGGSGAVGDVSHTVDVTLTEFSISPEKIMVPAGSR